MNKTSYGIFCSRSKHHSGETESVENVKRRLSLSRIPSMVTSGEIFLVTEAYLPHKGKDRRYGNRICRLVKYMSILPPCGHIKTTETGKKIIADKYTAPF
ncbi:MAG: hypothetical protein R2942_03480 [Ignavibacteria bacterium]